MYSVPLHDVHENRQILAIQVLIGIDAELFLKEQLLLYAEAESGRSCKRQVFD